MTSTTPHRAIALALLVAVAAVAGGGLATITATAQEDTDDGLATISVTDEDDGPPGFVGDLVDGLTGGVAGLVGSGADGVDNFVRDLQDEEPTPDEEATELKEFVNSREQPTVDHLNRVITEYNGTVRNTTYVAEVTITSDEAPDRTLYVIAEADGENITSIRAVDDTTLPVDVERETGVFTAEDLNEDLREYDEEYVQAGEIPEADYLVSQGIKYDDLAGVSVNESDA